MVIAPPKPGDFFVTSIKGEVGRLISFGEWLLGDGMTPWDHAGIYVGDGQVVEAEPGGARVAEVSEYDGRPIAWSTGRVALTNQQRHDIVAAARRFAEARVGYSVADYFAIAAHRFHLPVPGLREYVASSGHMICSQLVDRVFEIGGVQLFSDHRWSGYVVPASLGRLIGAAA